MTEFRPATFRIRRRDRASRRRACSRAPCRAPEWTHEAHLAATTYLLLKRPDIDLDSELAGLIRRYNESVGGVNSDTEGYHETITRVFLHGVRLFLAKPTASEPLHELVNELLLSPMGRRDWPLRFYSRERLFSVEARRNFVEPDLACASLSSNVRAATAP